LAEARALLPYIREDLVKLRETKQVFEQKYAELRKRKEEYAYGRAPQGGEREPFFELECELDFLQMEAKSAIRQFFDKGVQIKDIDTGLVDFPGRLNGRDVLLCWKMGEETIEYYHSPEDGFAGRKRIEE
jgi:hypothetical protein